KVFCSFFTPCFVLNNMKSATLCSLTLLLSLSLACGGGPEDPNEGGSDADTSDTDTTGPTIPKNPDTSDTDTDEGESDGGVDFPSCGWDKDYDLYDCGYVGEDPSGQHPIACEVNPLDPLEQGGPCE